MNEEVKTCKLCLMDSTAQEISFDERGVCNFCNEAEALLPTVQYSLEQENKNLGLISNKIKSLSSGQYDCILGLSGGVDSSYVAVLAHRMKLKPLCVHFDNGWNSEIAVKNIKRIVSTYGFDLTTLVIDWPEFRDLQRAFLRAGVIDIEMITDHAILATLFKLRRKHGIKAVLSGNNIATEHGLPASWVWRKTDLRNIKHIHKKYGELELNNFPMLGSIRWMLIKAFNLGGELIEPLNQINYSRSRAVRELKEEVAWESYGDKHCESVFTKFYQYYFLPRKFGIDKRKAFLSALIRNREMSRDEAFKVISEPGYSKESLAIDKDFVLKKLGFSYQEFDQIIEKPAVPHDAYNSDQEHIDLLKKLFRKEKTSRV